MASLSHSFEEDPEAFLLRRSASPTNSKKPDLFSQTDDQHRNTKQVPDLDEIIQSSSSTAMTKTRNPARKNFFDFVTGAEFIKTYENLF